MENNFTQNLNLLNEAVIKSISASSEEEIVTTFTHVVIKMLKADYGFVFLKESDDLDFRLIYKSPDTPFNPPSPRVNGVTQTAFERKEPICEYDYSKSPWLIKALQPFIKGFVAMPITYLQHDYGTFNICFSNVHEFTPQEKILCGFIGHASAQAIAIHRLVRSEQQARIEAEDQKQRFQALIENSYDAILLLDAGGVILYSSPATSRVTGYLQKDLVNHDMQEFIYPDDLPAVIGHLRDTLGNVTRPHAIEFRYRHKDGSMRWMEAVCVNMLNNPSVQSVVVNARDVTERRQSEETILRQALHDPLTNLPNRTELVSRLDRGLEQAKRHGHLLAVMFVDMDRFKKINDNLGHGVGDTLLKVMASRFQSCLRAEDTVSRFGGDEFIIFLSEINSSQDAARVAEKVLKVLTVPVTIGKHTLHPSASIGIAVYPHDGLDTESLKKHADIALYRAKQSGRNRYEFYDRSMEAYSAEKFTIETELREALALNQINLYYQPIISIKRNKIVGVEALARWQHPTRGLLLPNEFIPLAEETGLILPLGDYVLRQACQQFKLWANQKLPKFRMSINVSPQQFSQEGFVREFGAICEESGLEPQHLELEVTESLAMSNLELTSSNLKELKKMGARITIDDFGTGYSSLSYLKRFPINNLKIDRSFIRGCIANGQDASIVRTVISMAHNLNLKVTAEGVETQQQLNFLKSLECDFAQGFYIGQPMPPEDLPEWIREFNNIKEAVTA